MTNGKAIVSAAVLMLMLLVCAYGQDQYSKEILAKQGQLPLKEGTQIGTETQLTNELPPEEGVALKSGFFENLSSSGRTFNGYKMISYTSEYPGAIHLFYNNEQVGAILFGDASGAFELYSIIYLVYPRSRFEEILSILRTEKPLFIVHNPNFSGIATESIQPVGGEELKQPALGQPGVAAQAKVSMMDNTDLPGSDLNSFDLKKADPNVCAKACIDEPQCRAFVYGKPDDKGLNARCWLKNGVPAQVKAGCCVSGVIEGR
jgi:hypothetical protein